MTTYQLFDDLQDQAAIESFLAREAARKADLRLRSIQTIQGTLRTKGIDSSSWAESTYAELLATDDEFSSTFQVNYPGLACFLQSCGFKFAGQFFAPLLVIGIDENATLELMTDVTSVVY